MVSWTNRGEPCRRPVGGRGRLGDGVPRRDGGQRGAAQDRARAALSTLFGTLEAQSYVYNVYLLSLSSLLILAGALGDHYGRRRMFALGLIGFTLTSVLCGIAPTMELLIVARFLQGAAGALLVPRFALDHHRHLPEGEPRGGPWDMGRSDDPGDAGRTFGRRLRSTPSRGGRRS